MPIISDKVLIGITGATISYYENLGYKIPKGTYRGKFNYSITDRT